jgi:hypothetical protein
VKTKIGRTGRSAPTAKCSNGQVAAAPEWATHVTVVGVATELPVVERAQAAELSQMGSSFVAETIDSSQCRKPSFGGSLLDELGSGAHHLRRTMTSGQQHEARRPSRYSQDFL